MSELRYPNDYTPEGRPNGDTPAQRFRSEFLERNYLSKDVSRTARRA